ncbi:hypothetical protein LD681_16340 [Salmonella enterica]|nr:hypothetical protein [Salmonella enterica]
MRVAPEKIWPSRYS